MGRYGSPGAARRGIRPSFHTFVASRAPWEQLPDDGLPRYEQGAR